MNTRLVACSLAAACFAVPSLAQWRIPDPVNIQLQAPNGAIYTRAVHEELTGDFLADVVLLRGATAFVCCSPGLFESVLRIVGKTVYDVDVLPPIGDETRGSLILATRTGIEKGVFNGTTDTFTWTVLFDRDPDWAEASQVRVWMPDPDGFDDFVGVDKDRRRILTRFGTAGDYEAGQPLDCGAGTVIKDIALFDADLDGNAELAVWTTSWFRVYDVAQSGLTPVLQLNDVPYSPGGFARIRLDGARDELAWIRTTSGVNQSVYMIRQPGLTMEATATGTAFGAPYEIVRLASGDYDGDGKDDLLLSQRYDRSMILLRNVGTGSIPFVPALADTVDCHFVPLRGSGPQPLNEATPLMFDLDLDGDFDLAQVVQDCNLLDEKLMLVHVDQTTKRPLIDFGFEQVILHKYAYFPNGYPGYHPGVYTTGLEFTTDATNRPSLSEASHIEYVLWKRPSVGADTPGLALGSTFVQLFSTINEYPVTLPLQETELTFEASYEFTERYVLYDPPSQKVLKVHPGSANVVFDASQFEVADAYFGAIVGAGQTRLVGGIPVGGTGYGGITPEPFVPDFVIDQSPKVPSGM